ncbi:MAG: TatD family hydrolase [Candidatus Paceibacterota bacterium]
MKYIDIHAHLNFAVYQDDLSEVVKRTEEAEVAVINVGTQKNTSEKAVQLALAHKHMYAIVGLHPIHTEACFHDESELGAGNDAFTSRGEEFDYEFYKTLGKSEKVVGIGECGLDYFRLTDGSYSAQSEAFDAQLRLAEELKKPVMLHTRPQKGVGRRVYADVLEHLKRYPNVVGNLHFFAGTWEEAKEFLNIGYTLSATGVITFVTDYHEVIKNIPLESLMSETDCPYVTPVPFRGQRNEPIHVREVVKKIAEIKNLPLEEVRIQLLKNAERVFGISLSS